MRSVRLNLTDGEYNAVYDKAIENGFASVPEYLRYVLFDERQVKTDFEELLKQFEKSVNLRNNSKEFKVRNCFETGIWEKISFNDRKTLGRMIIHKVEKGGWLPIVPTKKESGNAQWYKKI